MAVENAPARIGKTIVICGEVKGGEDLIVDGRVEGTVILAESRLTIGPNANVAADLTAKDVLIMGHVQGNVVASGRVELRAGCSVEGDIRALRLAVEDNAVFRGKVDLTQASPRRTKCNRPGRRHCLVQRFATGRPDRHPPGRKGILSLLSRWFEKKQESTPAESAHGTHRAQECRATPAPGRRCASVSRPSPACASSTTDTLRPPTSTTSPASATASFSPTWSTTPAPATGRRARTRTATRFGMSRVFSITRSTSTAACSMWCCCGRRSITCPNRSSLPVVAHLYSAMNPGRAGAGLLPHQKPGRGDGALPLPRHSRRRRGNAADPAVSHSARLHQSQHRAPVCRLVRPQAVPGQGQRL